ncbi:serine--tRNA ligase, partial [Streptomyces sp. FL07-04A]|nr:serine--tRNA ligase [Streptomyces sp. FL07-04A]
MLDVTLIRQHPDRVRDALRKRGVDAGLPAFLALDAEFRAARATVERLRGERRRVSAQIAARRRADAGAAPVPKDDA